MQIRLLLLVATLASVACSHEQPFETPDTGSSVPFHPGSPVRLTYNAGGDYRPAWTADGSSFLYAWQYLGQTDHDRCLGQIPATGGSSTRTICNTNPAAADSTDLFDAPSPSEDGQLLYLRGSSQPGAVAPNSYGIYLATLANPIPAQRLLSLPTGFPGGQIIGTITTARWLSRTRLMYVSESLNYSKEYKGAPLDTLVTGQEVVEMDLSGPQPGLAVVPGTSGATSIALSDGRDTLYFTVLNDSKVYRLALATAQFTVAHDFGALGIARDVTVRGSRMVAVVGGEVVFSVDSTLGPIQPDGGGALISVDLTSGAESALPGAGALLFRRPAFSPPGSALRLIVEAYPPRPVGDATRNALVSKVGDLYMYEAP